MRIDVAAADALRWFVFPSEGAALLRKALPLCSPREPPEVGSHLPLSVVPEHGRVAGVIRPVGYDDARGASDLFASAEPWPSGLERVGDLDGEVSCDVSFRAVSSKYPLRVTAKAARVDGRGGLAVARRGEETAVEETPGDDRNDVDASGFAEERTTPPKETNGSERPATTTTTDRPTARSTASSDDDASGVPALGTPDPSDPPRRVEPEKSSSAPATEVAFAGRGFASPPAKLMRSVAKAVSEWQMIVPGDRVMLGLSGGKDSLAMLHILKALQRRYPPGTFSLACCTIDPGTEAFNPRPLIEYCASLGVEYHYREERIMEMASTHMSGDSICAFCARMKRGALYSCMRAHGYNKLVLAQHLDDVVESFLMSTMHNGLIRTMKAAYVVDEGDLTVIRPGIYCRERALRDFAYAAGLPVINENCPACFEAPKERHHIKKLLAREEGVFPSLYPCLRNALTPLLDPAATDLLAAIRRSVESQSKTGRQALLQKNAAARKKRALKRENEVPGERTEPSFGPQDGKEQDAETTDGEDDGVSRDVARDVSATALRDCTEAELLAELVSRRTRSRLGKDKGPSVGDEKPSPAPATDLGDAEMRLDVAELNAFCTADGCVRAAREEDDDE
jgi:tRNA(Ile)-lysidine synthase TilS/MesJ